MVLWLQKIQTDRKAGSTQKTSAQTKIPKHRTPIKLLADIDEHETAESRLSFSEPISKICE